MRNLQLSLKSKWFEMTKAGIKTEDYREITPYFCNRFLLYQGKSMLKKWWLENYFEIDGNPSHILEIIENINLFCTYKKFTTNIMTLGYPKKTDTERILKLEHKGIEIDLGLPEWGAEPFKYYFVIKHGEILE
jgi:hypothetical protein